MKKISAEMLNDLAFEAALDSQKHGYQDYMWPTFRTMTKAACEVAEAVNAYRDHKYADMRSFLAAKKVLVEQISFPDFHQRYSKLYEQYIKDTIQDEMADAAIYTLLVAKNGKVDFKTITEDDKDWDATIAHDFVTEAGMLMRGMLAVSEPLHFLAVIRTIEAWMYVDTNMELATFLNEKMEYNRYRAFRHGRTYDPTL